MPARRTPRPATKTAEEAILRAQEAGETVETTMDAAGKEFAQRPLSLAKTPSVKSALDPGKRVRVYNKRRSRLFCTDCSLEAEGEGSILATDLKIPGVRANVLELK